MRIAYVEDNATNQALVERVARMTQHVIVPYAEGETALEALRSEPFDLIMMDVELAGNVNGLDVVRGLRCAGLKTPIIAVTAYAMLGDRDRCLEAGCDDYLPKPIPIKDLLDLLGRYDAKLKAPAPPAQPVPAPVVPLVVAEVLPGQSEAQPVSAPEAVVAGVASTEALPLPEATPALEAQSPLAVAAPVGERAPEPPALPQAEASPSPGGPSPSLAEGSTPAPTPA